jgi:hypothetical protein
MSTKRQIEIEKIAFVLREEQFWTQRVYARDVFGRHVSPFSNVAVSFCLQGAEMGKVTHTSEAPIMGHCAAFNDTSTYREVWDFLVKLHRAAGTGEPEVQAAKARHSDLANDVRKKTHDYEQQR